MLDEFLFILTKITPPVILVFIPVLLFFKSKKKFLVYVLSLLITVSIVYSLKYGFGIPRPEAAAVEAFSPRFPSGHTALAFLLVGYFRKLKYRLPLLGFAILTAYSRLHLKLHKPVDLLVGAAIGFLVPLVLWRKKGRLNKILEVLPFETHD